MTCIVGFVDKGVVYIGGDSAGVSGLNLRLRKDPKVFKKGDFVYGYTSSFRMGQLIRFHFKAPTHPKIKGILLDDYEYMCTLFVDALRKCFKEGGYSKVDNNVETGGSFLVGYQGVLYQILSDYQVGISESNYDAVGCGEGYALGAMSAMEDIDYPPMERVIRALLAAEELSGGVRGPFKVVDTRQCKPGEPKI